MNPKIYTRAVDALFLLALLASCANDKASPAPPEDRGPCEVDDGQCIFRHDTFGDEQLWTDVLRLQELVETLPPKGALGVGLKVDADAVPAGVLAAADLDAPATTVALIGLDAVVGVRGVVENDRIVSIGITCALCHSTVDDSVSAGIGKRLDGWPNRDLDPGAIIALTPGLPALAMKLGVDADDARAALQSWGPGKYDARFNQDKESHPVTIPAAYGLEDVALETYTGEGPVSYWNAYVAVTQMGGRGEFIDDRLGLAIEVGEGRDRVTPMLPALREYQFTLEPPPAPADGQEAAARERGKLLFEGPARCVTCHAGPSLTDAPALHAASETGMDGNEARRSKTGRYRTTPLRGLWQRPPYFHDGSAATLSDVVSRYDGVLGLSLTEPQKADLEQYLRSL